jgi:hypothetical protein
VTLGGVTTLSEVDLGEGSKEMSDMAGLEEKLSDGSV